MINAISYQKRRLAAAFIIGSLAFTFIGCSGSVRVRKPAELTPVTNQFEMLPVWTTNVGSSEKFNFHFLMTLKVSKICLKPVHF